MEKHRYIQIHKQKKGVKKNNGRSVLAVGRACTFKLTSVHSRKKKIEITYIYILKKNNCWLCDFRIIREIIHRSTASVPNHFHCDFP